VGLVRIDVSEEPIGSIRVKGISELETTLVVTRNRRTLQRVFLRSILQLLVAVNIVSSSLILFTLMMEAKRLFSQEPYVVTSQKTAFFLFTACETSNLT
jgi:hypothetical protein